MSDEKQTAIILAQVQELESEAEQWQSFAIMTTEDATEAAVVLKDVKTKAKQLETLRLSLTRPLDESKKRIMAMFAPAISKFESAETAIKKSLQAYQQAEQKRLNEIQAQKDRELAKARAEAEEKERQLAKAKAEAEAQAQKGKIDEAAIVKLKAQEEENKGRLALLDAQAMINKVAPEAKIAGFSTRKTWRSRVRDKKLFVEGLHTGRIPLEAIDLPETEPEKSYLGQLAKDDDRRKAACEWPGVEFFQVETPVSK